MATESHEARNFQISNGLSASQPATENLKFERADWTSFRTIEGLQQKAGVVQSKLRRLVLKELADNALDTGARVRIGQLPGAAATSSKTAAAGSKVRGVLQDSVRSADRVVLCGLTIRRPGFACGLALPVHRLRQYNDHDRGETERGQGDKLRVHLPAGTRGRTFSCLEHNKNKMPQVQLQNGNLYGTK
jgi:hypothetical protein